MSGQADIGSGIDVIAVLLLGPILGSFISALVERLPDCRGLVAGRSRCPDCGAALRARDLVPLVSYLILGGYCRACGGRIAWVYPVAELGALAVSFTAVILFRGADLWLAAGLGWALVALTLADVRKFLLPDFLVLPLLLAGLATILLEPQGLWPALALERGIGVVLGFCLLEGVRRLYFHLRGHEGLGFGDVKLLAAAGAWLGWQPLPHSLFLSGVLGLAAVAILRLRGRRFETDEALPFGAFLAPSVWILWLIERVHPGFLSGLLQP